MGDGYTSTIWDKNSYSQLLMYEPKAPTCKGIHEWIRKPRFSNSFGKVFDHTKDNVQTGAAFLWLFLVEIKLVYGFPFIFCNTAWLASEPRLRRKLLAWFPFIISNYYWNLKYSYDFFTSTSYFNKTFPYFYISSIWTGRFLYDSLTISVQPATSS